MKDRGLVFARIATLAVLLILAVCPALRALEPPWPGQIEQYKKDGTLAEKVAAAEALGNHKVSPRLVWDARNRLAKSLTGEDPPDSMTPPPCWQGGLPSSGNPKVLTILIAFSDTPPVAGDTQPLITSKLFGDGTDGPPYESLRNFYRRSSYNQLDIGGDALGWYTTAYPRSSVPETDAGREDLIKEVLTYYDSQGHDFSQYDNDGDGQIESFSIIWTGSHGAWATFWWGYYTGFSDSSFTIDGKHLGGYSWQWESYNYPSGLFEPSTIIHETGHSLGLPDYYDYDGSVGPDGGVGGLDQMDGGGDHNCFSKFLLDWITPAVCGGGGAHTATLHPSEISQDAIIAMPTATTGNAFDEYFMIQVRNRTGNDVGYPNDGILIWHVDARLDSNHCDYRYNNSYTAHKLLRLMEADGLEEIEKNKGANAGDYYTQGSSFGDATFPNSKRYDGTPTGVTANTFSAYADPMTFDLDCAACTVNCTASAPTSGVGGQPVAFKSTASVAPASCGTAAFAWDFDDNGTTDSTLQNPSYAYREARTYTWKLTVTGTSTSVQCVQTGTVTITSPCALTCTATVPATGVAGAPVLFRSTATFTPTSCGIPIFAWDFDGDGATESNQQNPSFTYDSPGTYAWKLTIIGSGGAGTCTKSGTITIGEACSLSCTATAPATATSGQGVDFQATATPAHCAGSPAYVWSFGDGAGSTQQNPNHTYSWPGSFNWSMTATVGGAPCTKSGTIAVTSPCVLACTATAPSTATAGLPVSFQSAAIPSNCAGSATFVWAFGDGGASAAQNPAHTYAAAGSYAWTLTATMDGKTCAKTGTISVSEACAVSCAAGAAPTSGVAPLAVAFTATTEVPNCNGVPTFAWTFGDGASSMDQNPNHTYSSAGSFAWTLAAAVEGKTCTRTGTVLVVAPCTLTCEASASPSTGKAPLAVSFTASATASNCAGEPVYTWNFGDGATSTEQNPSHGYTVVGNFTWRLAVTAGGVTCARTGSVTVEAGLPGDADGDGAVSIGEVQQAINMFLEMRAPGNGVDCDSDGAVSIGEVQKVINAFLGLASQCS